MKKSAIVLSKLLKEHGCELLDQPFRIHAFLKDLAPEQPKEVFVLTEVILSGVLDTIRLQKPQLDSELQGFAASLTAQSGVVPNLALWAVQIWVDLLPAAAYFDEVNRQQSKQHEERQGSIEDILGGFR